MKFVLTALTDADLILYMTDVVETGDKNPEIIQKLNNATTPILVLINKIDLGNQDLVDKLTETWKLLLPKASIMAISALNKINMDKVLEQIILYLPENPPYFPKDELTDRTLRFFVSEIIREKIFLNYQQEIPYSVEVEIEEYQEGAKLDRIRAIIHVARESQKGIIIGNQGKMLKLVGPDARRDMEAFIGKKVFLELFVKVSKDWRDKPGQLKQFGYIM